MKKFLCMIMISVFLTMPVMAETDSYEVQESEAAADTPEVDMPENCPVEPEEERPKGPGEVEYVPVQTEAPEPEKGPGIMAELPQDMNERNTETYPNRWNLTINEEEKDLIARITMLESGGESDLGQQAVVEVILNRIYSPEFPNTATGVLSQVDGGYRQFSTWKSRNSRSAIPSARVIGNVNAVLNGETSILPYETIYFSRRGENRRVQAVIGNHVFCNR